MSTRRGWLEWRYAAAGLGWGVAVGAGTGLLLALAVAVSLLPQAGELGAPGLAGLILGLPVYGVLVGGLLGGVAGVPGGVVNALLQPRVRGDRAAWWSTWVVATLTAAAVVGVVTAWQSARGTVDPEASWVLDDGAGLAAFALALAPALVGGWLTARTGRGLRARRGDGASALGAVRTVARPRRPAP